MDLEDKIIKDMQHLNLICVSTSQILCSDYLQLGKRMKEIVFWNENYSHGYLKKMSAFKLIDICF